jgi:hypothetical protein
MFKCPSLGRGEVRSDTHFDRIELHRGAQGLCLRIKGPAVPTIQSDNHSYGGIGLAFHRPGRPGRTHEYTVTLAAAPDGAPGFWITVARPDAGPPDFGALPLMRGQLGMAPRQAAILIEQTELPRWVLDPRTPWRIRLG